MDWRAKLGGFYAILDRDDPQPGGRSAVGRARVLQIRFKRAAREDLLRIATWARRLTAERGALLVVNDDLDVALAAGADAVHLGQDDLPLAEARRRAGERARSIGVSTHDARPGGARGRRRRRLPRLRAGLPDREQGQPGSGGRHRRLAAAVRAAAPSRWSPSAASRPSGPPRSRPPAPTPRAPSLPSIEPPTSAPPPRDGRRLQRGSKPSGVSSEAARAPRPRAASAGADRQVAAARRRPRRSASSRRPIGADESPELAVLPPIDDDLRVAAVPALAIVAHEPVVPVERHQRLRRRRRRQRRGRRPPAGSRAWVSCGLPISAYSCSSPWSAAQRNLLAQRSRGCTESTARALVWPPVAAGAYACTSRRRRHEHDPTAQPPRPAASGDRTRERQGYFSAWHFFLSLAAFLSAASLSFAFLTRFDFGQRWMSRPK